jgi:hypothetical protein
MNNQDIFNDFDMVVAMTQKTINDQLVHLTRLGVINSELIITQTYDVTTKKENYKILASEDDLPKKQDGSVDENKLDAYLQGTLKPQLSIHQSGTVAMLVLNFLDGAFGYYGGSIRNPIWNTVDMTGWVFGISVNMDLAGLAKADINSSIAVPSEVENQLTTFMDNMFTVNHLFMDFESTDLINFDPTITNVGSADDDVKKQFVFFMQEYLKAQKDGKNPYVLGYVMSATEQSNYASYGNNVPDSLRPVGTTYNFYKDSIDTDLSTLNFALVTKGGHKVVSSTPGNFDSNWIGANEQCDAKMIYSHQVLIEQFILMPVYHQIRDDMYNKIKDHLSVDIGNDYEHARYKTANGFQYQISNKNDGNDHYVNNYSVGITNVANDSRVDITFQGHLKFYKRNTKDMGICEAVGEAWTNLDWGGTVSLNLTKDSKGIPNVSITKNFTTSNPDTGQDKNGCAEAWTIIGQILGTLLDAFSFGLDGMYFTNLFADVFGVKIDNVGDIGDVLGDMGATINTVLLLPAGNVFFIKNPMADPVANLYLELTYKSEH